MINPNSSVSSRCVTECAAVMSRENSMKVVDKKQLNDVLSLLFSAQMFFLREIKSSCWDSIESVNALDKLEHALRFARNPENEIPVCPGCGGIFYQELGKRDIQCLDCDFIWSWNREELDNSICEEESKLHSDFYTVVRSLKKARTLLTQHETPNLKKSAIFVEQAIEWALKQKKHNGEMKERCA